MNAEWYFSAPWDPLPVRRGDALGLRAGADYFADIIAPGLSSGTFDSLCPIASFLSFEESLSNDFLIK